MECEQGSTCIEDFDSRGQAYAACAIGGVPDPKCNRDTNKRFCDGNTLVRHSRSSLPGFLGGDTGTAGVATTAVAIALFVFLPVTEVTARSGPCA